MATTYKIRPIAPVRYERTGAYMNKPIGSSQTFKQGAVLFLDNDGTVKEGSANPESILGFATSDAAGYDWDYDTFGTVVPSIPVSLAHIEHRGTLKGTYNSSTDIGAEYGLTLDSTSGYWVVDKTKTAGNARVMVLDVDTMGIEGGGEIQDGDIDVPVTFIVLPANRQVK